MRTFFKNSVMTGFLGLFLLTKSWAAVSPIALAVFPVFEFPPPNFTISPLRLSLFWGEHDNVYGLDLGFIGNITEKDFVGTSFSGIFNKAGNATVFGGQFAFGANMTKSKANVFGVQAAGIANLNEGDSNIFGLQAAFVLNKAKKVVGLQMGFYNKAEDVYGLQFGFINIAKALHGLQVGLVNLNASGPFKFFPFFNFGF